MKNLKITAAIALMALGVSTLAGAQPRDPRDDHRPPQQQMQRPGPPQHGPQQTGPRHMPPPHREPVMRHHEGRGIGPDRAFYRGDRLPPQYRTHYYVVNDWRGHRLSAPPRGYNWVQTGGDYALVAIATGVIAQIILSQ